MSDILPHQERLSIPCIDSIHQYLLWKKRIVEFTYV